MKAIKSNKKMSDTLPTLSIYSRWGLFDRMQDGYCEIPNRREWPFQKLYEDWIGLDFFKSLRELGFVKVSYNNGVFADFVPSTENGNRHQALALSCFLSSRYADSTAQMTCPHERGGEFTATFERVDTCTVMYTNDVGSVVRFSFNYSRPSQF